MHLKYVLLVAESKQLSRLVSRDAICGRRGERGSKSCEHPSLTPLIDVGSTDRSKRRNIRVPLIPVKAHDVPAERRGRRLDELAS